MARNRLPKGHLPEIDGQLYRPIEIDQRDFTVELFDDQYVGCP